MPTHAANIVDAAALADELARYRVVDPNRLGELLAEISCDSAQLSRTTSSGATR